ncbi:MAG: PBP1A family penicillin-binding protein [Rhodospirillales bacterium]|nr:PBP1A family penicillin-binding protein [Rhodospirillales bacterium]
MVKRQQRKKATEKKTAGKAAKAPKGRLSSILTKLAAAAVWAAIILGGILTWYAYDLPDVERAFTPERRPSITLLAADGSEMTTSGDVFAGAVRLEDLPPALTAAVLSTEDRRFRSHFGIDVIGLGRAMFENLRAGRIVQGGSTITQQVAKNLFLTPQKTVKRKVQELLLAIWLEWKFSKDQILTVYLNRVYLGAGTYGIEAAARKYFGRSARDLTLYQSALIAGLLKAPSRYNPRSSPELADRRAGQVLDNMVAAGALSVEGAEAAKLRNRTQPVPVAGPSGRYFIDWVLEQVSSYVGPADRDLVVVTTFASGLQERMDAAIRAGLSEGGKKYGNPEVAVLAMTPAGAVRAMIGGRNYEGSQFNRATQARRQPGSAFKPIVYLAGLEQGLRPDSMLLDAPVNVGAWRPRNFNGRYTGDVTMADALARSINSVAVRISEQSGRDKVIETARRLGLTSELTPHPSLALGVSEVSLLELTGAYATFANGGYGVWPYGIEEIRDGQGQVLYRRKGAGPGRVVGEENVRDMQRMLAGVLRDGTGRAAALGRPAGGKTGTSQDYRDAWFLGYTADLVTGVWIGHDDDRSLKGMTGGGLPAKLWRAFMVSAHLGTPARPLPGSGAAPREEGPGFWQSLKEFFGSAPKE